MRPSRHLIAVGVGALIVLNTASPGASRPAPSPSNSDTKTSQPQATSSAPSGETTQPASTNSTKTANQTAEAAQAQTTPAEGSRPPLAPTITPSPAASPAPGAPSSPAQPPAPSPNIPEDPTAQPSQVQPIGPAKPGPAPDYLNPDPNPLQFPTRPSEVRLQGIQPITLQQAIELAQRNNRNLQVFRLQRDRSRAALRESQAALYPTLNIQTGLSRSQSASGELSQRERGENPSSLQSLLGGNSDSDRASNSLTGTAALSYDVFTSGSRPAQIRAAERQLRSDELQVEITEQQLRLDVTGDYYDLQSADESVRINEAAVRNAEASLRDTQALERAGLGTRFETLQAQVQLANAQQNLTNSRAQQQISRRQLAQRLSVSQFVDLAAADPVAVAGNWTLPLEESIVLAFKNRAELEQQLVAREQSEQQRRAALAALGPRITVSANYQILNSLDDDFGFADGYTLTAGINWDLFDGGAAVARARQAEANGAIAETRFADNRNQIRFQVEQAYSNLLSSTSNIQTATIALGQAREALRLARLRFQAGVGTQTDVINSETALTQAEGNRVNAIIGYNRALAQLQRAISNLPANAITPATGGLGSPSTTAPTGTTAPATNLGPAPSSGTPPANRTTTPTTSPNTTPATGPGTTPAPGTGTNP